MASPSWCTDVTPSVVSQWLGGRPVRSLAFRNARELDQSNVVVVVPSSSEEEEAADTSPSPLPPLLLKRTCIAWLQQRVVGRSAEKWAVSLRSFAAEQHFYALAPVDELARAGCAIPRVYHSAVTAGGREEGGEADGSLAGPPAAAAPGAGGGGGGRLPALPHPHPHPHPLLGLHHGPRAPPDPLALRRAQVL
jgi:hypothetical protein